MKKEFETLSWFVTNYDCNADKIEYYDVLKYREDFIKKLKKKCTTKEEFSEKMRSEFRWQYWSRCEYELIVEVTEDERVLLKPWVGCRDAEKATVDVTDRKDFDWRSFAEYHIGKQIYKNEAKIDVYSQLEWSWNKFIDYCWHNRLKYERDNPKFYKQ